MLRSLVAMTLVVPLLLAGCGGGGGGDATPTGADPATETPATTPASASFPAAAAYRSYTAAARQQNFTLSPFGFCMGSATLTETAPAAASFEGNAALRQTSTWVFRFTNCVPDSATRATELFLDADHAPIGESRSGVRYVVLDRPLALPAAVKVSDAGELASGSIYTDSTKASRAGTIVYSFAAEADDRTDAILVRLTATTTNTLGQQSTEAMTYRITTDGAMGLIGATLNENGRRLILSAE